jgi:phage FluMu protein Com
MRSRRLPGRVERLERAPGGARGPCPACKDVGRITLVDERRGDTRETARGCPRCGKVSKYIVLGRGVEPLRA